MPLSSPFFFGLKGEGCKVSSSRYYHNHFTPIKLQAKQDQAARLGTLHKKNLTDKKSTSFWMEMMQFQYLVGHKISFITAC